MPLKCGYDFANFRSGWSGHKYHPYAEDPRDVSFRAFDIRPVLPPKLEAPDPCDKAAEGARNLSEFVRITPMGSYREHLSIADAQLNYIMGTSFGPVTDSIFRAVARAYEASDCVAMQMKRERDLIRKGATVAKNIISARKGGRTHTPRFQRLLIDAADILEELRREDNTAAIERRNSIGACGKTQDRTVENLLGIKENHVQRGRSSDRARQFFVWRLTELYYLITGEHPVATFSKKESLHAPDDIRNSFHFFLAAVFDLTGLTWTPNSLDHYLRSIHDADLHQGDYLEWRLYNAADRRRPVALPLPSTGILIDYDCRRFYHCDVFPPEFWYLDAPPEGQGLNARNAG